MKSIPLPLIILALAAVITYTTLCALQNVGVPLKTDFKTYISIFWLLVISKTKITLGIKQ